MDTYTGKGKHPRVAIKPVENCRLTTILLLYFFVLEKRQILVRITVPFICEYAQVAGSSHID